MRCSHGGAGHVGQRRDAEVGGNAKDFVARCDKVDFRTVVGVLFVHAVLLVDGTDGDDVLGRTRVGLLDVHGFVTGCHNDGHAVVKHSFKKQFIGLQFELIKACKAHVNDVRTHKVCVDQTKEVVEDGTETKTGDGLNGHDFDVARSGVHDGGSTVCSVAVEIVRERVKGNEVCRVHDASAEGGFQQRDTGVQNGHLDFRLVLSLVEFLLDLVHAHVLDAPGQVTVGLFQLFGLYGLRELDLEDGVKDDVGGAVRLLKGFVGDFRGFFRAILQEIPAVEVDDVYRSLDKASGERGTGVNHDAPGLVEVIQVHVFPAVLVRQQEHSGLLHHFLGSSQERLVVLRQVHLCVLSTGHFPELGVHGVYGVLDDDDIIPHLVRNVDGFRGEGNTDGRGDHHQ